MLITFIAHLLWQVSYVKRVWDISMSANGVLQSLLMICGALGICRSLSKLGRPFNSAAGHAATETQTAFEL